jgi:hypothetical protein
MANNYEQATVNPVFPSSVVTPISKAFMALSGFSAYDDGNEVYFCCEEGVWEECLEFVHDTGRELGDDLTVHTELEQRILDDYTNGDINTDYNYCDVLQDMAKRAGIEEVLIEGAYTCDKMRMGEFGGFVTRITPDSIQYGSTMSILTKMREGTW